MLREYEKFKKNLNLLSKTDQKRARTAYLIAKKEHLNQKKFGIYPYIIHPLSVFNFIIQELNIRDINILLAALLHDTIEDGKLTFFDIQKKFGKKVEAIVRAVTRIPQTKESEKQKAVLKIRHFKRFIANGSYGVKIVGIADKYDNMKNMRLIPSGNPNYKKKPRWIKEAEKFISLAKKTNKDAWLIFKNYEHKKT